MEQRRGTDLPTGAAQDGRHGTSPVPLSILDLVVRGAGHRPADALQQSTTLAQAAERWGYRRFWVAEHHSFPASSSPAPAVLLAHLGAATRSIRLGSGGVMLTNHAPLIVAEQFGVLNAFHPGRIDLGVGRSPGGLPSVMQALRRSGEGSGGNSFRDDVEELLGFLRNDFPENHPYRRDNVHVVPAAPALPVWTLGSGTTGAEVAARLGLPFAAAFHINPVQSLRAVDEYRRTFRPSDALAAPHVMVSVNVTCAPTAPEAERLARPGALMMMLARQGKQAALPSPDEAENRPYTPEEKEFVEGWLGNVIHGAPDTVREGLTELQRRTQADELMLTSLIYDAANRIRSFALVAEEFSLSTSSS
ncbi:LLM class flavin-dependent oxidoreductase [Micromonospora sp. WMMD964]|uniref:LLM class flavin-dependent oxidoreductase n=1 Tax=Micromonospora sp. WMMD964 TaxID=3016091 RepID=UPI00249AA56F|nr:LLM class flavin-dependent oxidoreductase [Micromonospora sp. WMMD964]WFF00218.1 LLM class flavin-dependent oxidoreductase [Micromonospora sp. WMMD964]